MSTRLRVTVTIELDIDPADWSAEYGVDHVEVAEDVHRYFQSVAVGDSMASSFGPVATVAGVAVADPRALQEFRVTFGQRYRDQPHPRLRVAHPDGWVTILAESRQQASDCADRNLGQHWAFLYGLAEWSDADKHYPLGELACWTAAAS